MSGGGEEWRESRGGNERGEGGVVAARMTRRETARRWWAATSRCGMVGVTQSVLREVRPNGRRGGAGRGRGGLARREGRARARRAAARDADVEARRGATSDGAGGPPMSAVQAVQAVLLILTHGAQRAITHPRTSQNAP